MSDSRNAIVGRMHRRWILSGVVVAVALTIAAPGWAQSAEDLNYAELNRLTTAAPQQPAMPSAPPPEILRGTPIVPAAPSYPAQGYGYPADVDCNNPYYASYCQAYAAWLNQYYASYDYGYGYGYPYGNWYYGYPVDVAFGFGFFRGHRFHNFHHFAFTHGFHGGFRGGGFHRGFHGGGFRGGGFHGNGFHGGGFHGGGHR